LRRLGRMARRKWASRIPSRETRDSGWTPRRVRRSDKGVEEGDGALDVFSPDFGGGAFALDDEGAGVADFPKLGDVAGHADTSLPQGFFGAELARAGGPFAVLDVDGADVALENFHGIDGVRGAVEDHIGGVEVDGEVGLGGVGKEVEEDFGGFLTGFEVEELAVAGAMVADAADHGLDGDVVFVGLVVGDEADVTGEDGDADVAGKVRESEGTGLADLAGGGGDEADGALDGGDVGVVFAVIGGDDSKESEVFGLAGGFPFGGFAFDAVFAGAAELGAVEAEGFEGLDLFEGGLVVLSPEDTAEFEGF
jgi:hypothetical protein